MAFGISFKAYVSSLRVLLNDQELTLEDFSGGPFISDWKSGVDIDKNGVLKIIATSDMGISIFDNAYASGTPVNVSNGGSANIDINDYPDGMYISMYDAPPVGEYTYTLNITGFAVEKITQLTPFLTNIANAIRTKKGTTETINAQDFASEIESIESGSGGLVGYSGTINFTGLTSYANMSYLVIHSDGTYENITSVSATNNVSNAIYIGVDANNRYALASTRQTNTDRVFGIEQTYSFYQITGDNWVIEFYEDL